MEWFRWVMFIAALPIILMSIVGILYVVFATWVFVFAICGNKWAQEKVRGF